jgi:hypothetical protein
MCEDKEMAKSISQRLIESMDRLSRALEADAGFRLAEKMGLKPQSVDPHQPDPTIYINPRVVRFGDTVPSIVTYADLAKAFDDNAMYAPPASKGYRRRVE